jgi:hypothetical protein
MNDENFHLGRSVRVPDDAEARLAMAKDLSRTNLQACGFNWAKARRLLTLPLFEVAIEGHLGLVIAEGFAASRARRAA